LVETSSEFSMENHLNEALMLMLAYTTESVIDTQTKITFNVIHLNEHIDHEHARMSMYALITHA